MLPHLVSIFFEYCLQTAAQGHDPMCMLYLALGADGAPRKEHQLQPARTAFAEGNALEGPSPLVTG